MDTNTVLFAFGLTLFAGLATGIGSGLAFFARKTSITFLSLALGFSAGVMLYVSFVEILVKSRESLSSVYGAKSGDVLAVLSFFAGVGLIGLIDRFVPTYENPHEIRTSHDLDEIHSEHPRAENLEEMKDAHLNPKLLRVGIFTALAIAIHNFPEGLATFAAALADPALGISIAIAIAIHNIPEGISVSVPIFYATNNRRKAFFWSFLSGLAEPLGAVLGYFILRSWFSPQLFGVLFGAVAGIMVYISLDELLPTARAYGRGHLVIWGTMAGMAVMAGSLLLF
jgi:zinc transporter, ZIP family